MLVLVVVIEALVEEVEVVEVDEVVLWDSEFEVEEVVDT